MADISKLNAKSTPLFSQSSPFGNTTTLKIDFEADAIGALARSDVKTAIQTGDVAILGVIPAGFRIDSAVAVVSNAMTAVTTVDIGFRYVDGVDDADVPEDDNFLFDNLDGASLARTVSPAAAILTMPKDAFLIATITTTQAIDSAFSVLVTGELVGA